ncbi:hypothetical protein BaRGS_00032479 [Batillaria attramentaria]|uniref:Uncharacterized protein n=1 Tax=Batillaria attramentaria TaxID=370345 RepID=A0ABD0JMV5_9CAEN
MPRAEACLYCPQTHAWAAGQGGTGRDTVQAESAHTQPTAAHQARTPRNLRPLTIALATRKPLSISYSEPKG